MAASALATAMKNAPPMGSLLVNYDDVTTSSQIGSGGVGVVYRGTFKGDPVAVKIIDFKVPRSALMPEDQAFLTQEIHLMMYAGFICEMRVSCVLASIRWPV